MPRPTTTTLSPLLYARERDFGSSVFDAASQHIDRGLLAVDDDRIHLTRSGIYLSDSIMSDLMRI